VDEIVVVGERPPTPITVPIPGRGSDDVYGFGGAFPDAPPPEPPPPQPEEPLPEVTITSRTAPEIGFRFPFLSSLAAIFAAAPAPRRAPRRRAPPRRSPPKPPPRRTPRRPGTRPAPVRPGFPYLLPFRWTGLPSALVTAFVVGIDKLIEISDQRVRDLIGPAPPGGPEPPSGPPPARVPSFPEELPEVTITAPRPLPEAPGRPESRPVYVPGPLSAPDPGILAFPAPAAPPLPEISFPAPAPAPAPRPAPQPFAVPLPFAPPVPRPALQPAPRLPLTPFQPGMPLSPLSPGPNLQPFQQPIPQQAGCACPKPEKKDKRKKKPRAVCYRGSYREKRTSLTKRRRERIPCT
jgi:hypothetical protein